MVVVLVVLVLMVVALVKVSSLVAVAVAVDIDFAIIACKNGVISGFEFVGGLTSCLSLITS